MTNPLATSITSLFVIAAITAATCSSAFSNFVIRTVCRITLIFFAASVAIVTTLAEELPADIAFCNTFCAFLFGTSLCFTLLTMCVASKFSAGAFYLIFFGATLSGAQANMSALFAVPHIAIIAMIQILIGVTITISIRAVSAFLTFLKGIATINRACFFFTTITHVSCITVSAIPCVTNSTQFHVVKAVLETTILTSSTVGWIIAIYRVAFFIAIVSASRTVTFIARFTMGKIFAGVIVAILHFGAFATSYRCFFQAIRSIAFSLNATTVLGYASIAVIVTTAGAFFD